MFGKIKRVIKRATVKVIRAREQKAAADLARYLKTYNGDFKNCSEYDLQKAILSKEPVNFAKLSW
jgi:cytidylate kinase